MKPDISIIVPVYNSSDFLQKCLKSIQVQTLKNIEVILMNDGSNDNSLSICNTFAEIDNRFKVFTQTNAGVSSARNNGLKKALGDYICFVDSDDWIDEKFCEILTDNSNNNNYDLISCGYKSHFQNHIEEDLSDAKYAITQNNIIKSVKNYKKDNTNILGNNVWAKLFKKKIIKKNKIEFIENLRVGEDILFILQYQKFINEALHIPNKLYNYNRISKKSITISYVKDYWNNFIFVKKKIFEINKDIIEYDEEYKYYQYVNVATKAIFEEGKLNNGKKIIEKYNSIKALCNKKEVRYFFNNYKLQNENNTFYRIIKKLMKLNLPFVIVLLIPSAYKLKII